MKMKKYLFPLMALALSFSFVACSDDNEEETTTPSEQTDGGEPEKASYLYTFASKVYALADATEIELSLLDAKDASPSITVDTDIPVKVSVDEEKSTAKEGVDFTLSYDEVIKKGTKPSIKVTVTATPEATPGTLAVLQASFGDEVTTIGGQYPTVKVQLIGSVVKNMQGSWVMNQLVTTKEEMEATWGLNYAGFPEFNEEDALTIAGTVQFDEEDAVTIAGTIQPDLKSVFKDFFTGDAKYEYAGTYFLHTGMFGQGADLTVLKLTGVNRFFSETEVSEDNTAYIGVRIIKDENTNADLLDIYLIDYESHAWALELVEGGWAYAAPDEEHPYYAYMTGMFINFTMKKAQ